MAKCCNRREPSLQGFLAAVFLALTIMGAPHALAADPKFSFVDSRNIDLSRLLPPPPSDTSEVTRAELDAMLLIQERRSEAQAARALSDNEVGIEAFSEALGSSKSLADLRLPLLNKLARKVDDDSSPMIGAAKQAFGRPRPYALEKRLKPVVPLPGGSSLPSGHAVWGYITALMLADMVPERRVQILERGDAFGRSRVIAGVHFPSDVESSRTAAAIFTAFLFATPSYAKERAAAAKELRAALALPALPPKS